MFSTPLGVTLSNLHHGGVSAGLAILDVQWQSDHWPNSKLNRHLRPTGQCRQSKEIWAALSGGRKRALIYAPACSQGAERKSERSTTQSAKWSAALLPETKGISEDGWSAGREMVYPQLQTPGTKSCLLLNFPIATLKLKDSTFLPVKRVCRVSRLYFKEDIGTFVTQLYLLYHKCPFLPICCLADMPLVSYSGVLLFMLSLSVFMFSPISVSTLLYIIRPWM